MEVKTKASHNNVRIWRKKNGLMATKKPEQETETTNDRLRIVLFPECDRRKKNK